MAKVRDFFSVVRELSFDELRAEALLAPRLLVVARDVETATRCRNQLFGADAEPYVDLYATGTSGESQPDPLRYDVIVTVGPLEPSVGRAWRDLFRRVDEPARIVEAEPGIVWGAGDLDGLRRRIADVADERALSIGRYIDAMRGPCAEQVVSGTSMVNAQFALLSNIPTLVPVVGNLVAAGADFIVLTKNQLMMIYKLAAIFQRDLDNRWQIYSEMIPVVGSGLVWRTVARELSDLIPFAIGTVPKVAVAYVGTFVTGRTAQLYYERGTKVDRDQINALYREALARMRRTPLPWPTSNGKELPEEPSTDAIKELPEEHSPDA